MQAAHNVLFFEPPKSILWSKPVQGYLRGSQNRDCVQNTPTLTPQVGGIKSSFKGCPAYTFFVSTGLAAAYFDFF